MKSQADLLAGLSTLAPSDFAGEAYARILGRAPTPGERDQMVSALLSGETPTLLLGALRYGDEGRIRAVPAPGLRSRYVAQRLFRLPIVGALLQWANALARLPSSLKHFRALRALDVERNGQLHRDIAHRLDETRANLANLQAAIERRLEEMHAQARMMSTQLDATAARSEIGAIEARLDAATEQARTDTQVVAGHLGELRARVDALFPPALPDTLEVQGAPLVAVARERSGIAPETPFTELPSSARYAMFETVFYESPAVAEKQRVYLRYLDRDLGRRLPFLDLGCGRGEFLRILAADGLRPIGVDVNATSFPALRADGITVVEADLLAFLERDRETYAGVSLLQVAEHLTREQIDRLLALVIERIAPGGTFILETPNPLSPLALSHFHTDPTHVAPLPPEAMRYAVEAAGFERTRTLFQARVPSGQFAGSDPRAYYGDYAIIAARSNR